MGYLQRVRDEYKITTGGKRQVQDTYKWYETPIRGTRWVQDTYKWYKIPTRVWDWYQTPARGRRWVQDTFIGLKRHNDVSKSPVFMSFTFLVFWFKKRQWCVQIPCFMPFTFMVFWFEKGPWCVQIPCFHSFHLTAILDWKENMMCPNPVFSCLLLYWYFGLKRDNDVSKSPVFMPFTIMHHNDTTSMI